MKILKLEVEAFKRVSAVTIEPDGSTVIIGGVNGSGKSSTLDAIEAAIGGKRHSPGVPIQHGQDKARIVLETETLVVTRTFSSKGTYLKVTAKDGAIYPNPQKLLDGLVGPISFDPVAFSRQPAAKQAEVIAQLAGIDTTAFEHDYKETYELRTLLGRELRQLEGHLAGFEEVPADTPDEEVSSAKLLKALELAEATNRSNEHERGKVRVLKENYDEAKAEIEELEQKLENARAYLPQAKAQFDECVKLARQCVDIDTAAIRQQILQADAINKRVRVKKERSELAEKVSVKRQAVKSTTEQLADIDKRKREMVKNATYPIEGLRLEGDQVHFNDVPIDQASSAEQLRVSTAIALAINPQLKIALIRDGSLLDEDNLQAVAEIAEQYDAQVWIERVSTGDEVSVVIEDGRVK